MYWSDFHFKKRVNIVALIFILFEKAKYVGNELPSCMFKNAAKLAIMSHKNVIDAEFKWKKQKAKKN